MGGSQLTQLPCRKGQHYHDSADLQLTALMNHWKCYQQVMVLHNNCPEQNFWKPFPVLCLAQHLKWYVIKFDCFGQCHVCCWWHMPLLGYLCACQWVWNHWHLWICKIKQCVKESGHMLTAASLPSFTVTFWEHLLNPCECKHCKICLSLMHVPYFSPETSEFGHERLVSQ